MDITNKNLLIGSECRKENVLLLIEDAEFLIEKGSCGHAAFLALTAYEEYYKRFIFFVLATRRDYYDEKEQDLLFNGLIHHNKKAIGSMLLSAGAKLKEFIDEISSLEKIKNKYSSWKSIRENSLYVNWDKKDQHWFTPVALDSEIKQDATLIIKQLKRMMDIWEPEIVKDIEEYYLKKSREHIKEYR